MIDSRFEYITNLQYKVKTLTARVCAFENGEKYIAIKSDYENRLSEKNRENKRLKLALAAANERTTTVRRNLQQVIEDMEKEHDRAIKAEKQKNKLLLERVFKAERFCDEERDKNREKLKELYEVKIQLEEEKDKNRKLISQIKRDHENSSLPSSTKPNRKKIFNSREKTGKKPGGQPGHKGHGRKKQEPTNVIHIPVPPVYLDTSKFKPTGKIITKQVINLHVNLNVDEYCTPEFRNIKTRQLVHADFPGGIKDDVNYGGSVKAFAFLLNNHCCVSIDKTSDFLADITKGKLRISRGMINGLSKEFSKKTQSEQQKAFADLLLSPVMGADFTTARLNGKNVHVLVCATEDKVMYFARENKGHKGIADTPVEDYQNTLVHDHDKTFYAYATLHQECLAHILRYLKSSMENEPNLKWNTQMNDLIKEMIHYKNSAYPDYEYDVGSVSEYERRYVRILKTAEEEYEYEPPSKYYKDGYNLYKRLYEYKDNHLLFLYDKNVPATNNLCERLLRIFKRKQKQVMAFRGDESLEYLCDSLGIIASLRSKSENLYEITGSVFN